MWGAGGPLNKWIGPSEYRIEILDFAKGRLLVSTQIKSISLRFPLKEIS
jgi:hypothetical protein